MPKVRHPHLGPPPGPHASDLARIGAWLVDRRRQMADQVTVREGERGAEERTSIQVDHLLSGVPTRLGRLRVHSRRTFLPRAHFSSEARAYIANAARTDSGRVIYCEDPVLGEVIAAIAFHIGRHHGHPILVTTIALRDDLDANPALGARSLAGALVLKHYVHAVSAHLGRGGHVDLDLADSGKLDLMAELGFRKAPRVRDFQPGGTHLRQPAPR